jgi:hypothetical protein
MADSNSVIKQLEVEGNVPEYLKTSLVSEIELIKDTLQVVSLFGGGFFVAVFEAINAIPVSEEATDNPTA